MTRLATEVGESSQEPRRRGALAWFVSGQAITIYGYILGALFVTCRLWIHPAGLYQAGDTADVDQATWFVRYTATAVSHFRLPALETMAMNAPHGVNLMWNTSLLLPGVVVSPVTLLFGAQVALTTLLVHRVRRLSGRHVSTSCATGAPARWRQPSAVSCTASRQPW